MEYLTGRSRNDSTVYGQLCWSNQSLVEYLINACASFLTEQPHATILSASQNDNAHFCQSEEEKAINEAEGSPIGAMLRGVNAIAKALGPRFPQVRFDTLGNYPDTQPIPRITKPEANVIIRLCNGGANGSKAAALTDPINAEFANVVRGWYGLVQATGASLFIWNYAVVYITLRPLRIRMHSCACACAFACGTCMYPFECIHGPTIRRTCHVSQDFGNPVQSYPIRAIASANFNPDYPDRVFLENTIIS
jgi:hypothetical protein